MRYAIIGNGIAGTRAAETLRQYDPSCEIVMISKEKTIPYSRPLISHVVSGELKSDEIVIRSVEFYEDHNIECHLGDEVNSVNIENHSLILRSGKTIHWDRLLVASGANPRILNVEGSMLENIFVLRTNEDAQNIVSACQQGSKEALVLGGGLVGFKAAYGLMKRGLHVTMLITSPFPLSQVADAESGKMIRETLERHGLEVQVGRSVVAFEGKGGKVSAAILDDGTEKICDIVVVGKGVNPAVSFLEGTGVEINRGIVVNQQLESTVSGIYAAGDVCEAPDIVWNQNRVNAIWPVAVEQGRVAALNMLGEKTEYSGSFGRNVIRIFDLSFMAGGIVNPPEAKCYEVMTSVDHKESVYKKFVFESDRLVGMVLVNCVEEGGVLLNLVKQKRKIPGLKEKLVETKSYYPILGKIPFFSSYCRGIIV